MNEEIKDEEKENILDGLSLINRKRRNERIKNIKR